MEQTVAKEGPTINNKTAHVLSKPNSSTPLHETANYSSDDVCNTFKMYHDRVTFYFLDLPLTTPVYEWV